MTTFTEGKRTLEFLLSEANGQRSREEGVVTVAGSVALPSGTVLGKITVGAVTSAAVAGNTGNGTMGTVTASAGAKAGVYRLTIVEPAANAGAFIVEDPTGVVIGNGDVAAAFSAGGLSFTLADGATDFAAGDQFTITVAAGTGKYVKYDDTAANGSQVAAAILGNPCVGVNGDYKRMLIVREAEVFQAMLTGIDAAGIVDLAALQIVMR